MGNREERTFEVDGLEVRAIDGEAPTIAGYAVVFDSWSEVMVDGRGRPFRERIAPTAFDRALAANPDVRALWNHNSDFPLGRTRNGTLSIRNDGGGLRIELQPDLGTFWGASAVAAVRRGDVTGMSFAFSAKREGGDTWTKGADGVAERTLIDADLFEVSPVVFPAYPATSVGVRAMVPDFEESDGRAADDIAQAMRSRAADARKRQRERASLLISD